MPAKRERKEGEDRWPSGGTALIARIRPAGCTPVTGEALAAIVCCIVAVLSPDNIIL
ncbi:MAG: hypothetical protein ACRERE_13535 [Candidatus Entotheonellia bacterium]